MKLIKELITVLMLMCFMFGLVACGSESNPSQEGKTAKNNSDEKTYIIATKPDFPPFEFSDEKTNEITGFDIELMKEIAKEADIKVEVRSLGFDGLVPALQTGNIDIAISGISITPEREEAVDFGTPYWQAGLKIAVKGDNTEIKSAEDLKGKSVAVQIGTTGAAKAEELKEKGIIKDIKTFDAVSSEFMELMNGGVDAVINDLPVNEAYIDKNPGKVKLVGEVLDADEYGFAVTKGNKELLDKLNDSFEKVKTSGKYDELVEKYFGK